jgi:protein subunit release factor A
MNNKMKVLLSKIKNNKWKSKKTSRKRKCLVKNAKLSGRIVTINFVRGWFQFYI